MSSSELCIQLAGKGHPLAEALAHSLFGRAGKLAMMSDLEDSELMEVLMSDLGVLGTTANLALFKEVIQLCEESCYVLRVA